MLRCPSWEIFILYLHSWPNVTTEGYRSSFIRVRFSTNRNVPTRRLIWFIFLHIVEILLMPFTIAPKNRKKKKRKQIFPRLIATCVWCWLGSLSCPSRMSISNGLAFWTLDWTFSLQCEMIFFSLSFLNHENISRLDSYIVNEYLDKHICYQTLVFS